MIASCTSMQMSKSLSKDNILNIRIADLGVFKRVKSIGQPKFVFFSHSLEYDNFCRKVFFYDFVL